MRFLLIHGTTQSPDGWQRLTDELTASGHSASAIDLARFGERTSLTGYADAVAAARPQSGVDVVVAHSGSGLLLPVIAAATDARAQVFLAAFIPHGTLSLIDELNEDAAAMLNADWIGVDPVRDANAARHFLFHDCTPDVAEWALTTLRSFAPESAYAAPVPLAPKIRAISVVPDSDRTLRADWMIAASRERLGIEPTMLPGGHCPHVSRPRHLARILVSAVGEQ